MNWKLSQTSEVSRDDFITQTSNVLLETQDARAKAEAFYTRVSSDYGDDSVGELGARTLRFRKFRKSPPRRLKTIASGWRSSKNPRAMCHLTTKWMDAIGITVTATCGFPSRRASDESSRRVVRVVRRDAAAHDRLSGTSRTQLPKSNLKMRLPVT